MQLAPRLTRHVSLTYNLGRWWRRIVFAPQPPSPKKPFDSILPRGHLLSPTGLHRFFPHHIGQRLSQSVPLKASSVSAPLIMQISIELIATIVDKYGEERICEDQSE